MNALRCVIANLWVSIHPSRVNIALVHSITYLYLYHVSSKPTKYGNKHNPNSTVLLVIFLNIQYKKFTPQQECRFKIFLKI